MSQQNATVGVDSTPTTPPSFSIEINELIAKKFSQTCVEQNITMKELVSKLIQGMIFYHHEEVKEIVETIKKRTWRG